MKEIKLGNEARDIITGFQGIVTAELIRLNGSQELELQKQDGGGGKYPASQWIPKDYVEFVSEGIHVEPIEKEMGFQARKKKS